MNTQRIHQPRSLPSPWIMLAGVILICGAVLRTGWAQDAAAPEDPIQVRIEARVLEWQNNDSLDFDFAVWFQRDEGGGSVLDYSELVFPSNQAMTSAARLFLDEMDSPYGSFEAVIETLERVGDVEVLSQPSLMLKSQQQGKGLNQDRAASGYDSRVSTQKEIPFLTTQAIGVHLAEVTDYREAGVTMEVSVLHVEDGLIYMDVNTSVTDVTGFITVGRTQDNEESRVPTLDTRQIKNRLVVPDRQLSIAGLMKTDQQTRRRRGIPWISEIPVVNWLLSARQNTTQSNELVFLVRPEIITPYQKVEPGPSEAARPEEAAAQKGGGES